MARQRGGGSSARSGGLFEKKAAPAPAPASKPPASSGGLFANKAAPAPAPVQRVQQAPPPASTQHASSAPPPAAHNTSAPAPAPAHYSSPAPVSSGGGMMSGIGGMIVQGMAVGTGSAIAHHAVNGVINSMSGGSSDKPEAAAQRPVQVAQPVASPSSVTNGICALDQKELYNCLQEQNNNAANCQYYFDALRACQDNHANSSF